MVSRPMDRLQTSFVDQARTQPILRGMTERVGRLYGRLQQRMTQPQEGWGQDMSLLDQPGFAELPLIIRKAKAFEYTMLQMPIDIEDGDMVVGNALRDGVVVRTAPPAFVREDEFSRAEAEGRTINYGLAHKTPYYEDVLQKGLRGVLDEVAAKLAEIAARPDDDERQVKLDLFRAMEIELEACIALAHRFADLAEAKTEQAETAQRRQELLAIAAVCRRVPEYPATTFYEAIQSFWLVHFGLFMTHVQLSLGRMDQYLAPYLADDLETGRLALDEAQELLDCLWIRFNDRGQIKRENFIKEATPREATGDASRKATTRSGVVSNMAPRPWTAGSRKRWIVGEDRADAINHWGENVLLSGVRPDGGDGTNPLTYLCLNAHDKFSFTSPVLTVRLHKSSPPELVHRVAEVLKEDGSGMPYINNDDVLVQSYVDLGVSVEDARDYANSNCWETLIQGKTDQEMIRGINFLLLLELALHRGTSWRHGQMGPDTGDPASFASFDELMTAWQTQLNALLGHEIAFIGEAITTGNLEHSNHGKYDDYPLLSALTHDCIANERDLTKLGSRYTIWHVMGEALANTIDAMVAIKTLVFEQGTLSMAELVQALDDNWEGHEALRQRIVRRLPKFANDDPLADDLGQEMVSAFVERIREHSASYAPQVIFPPSIGTFSWVQSIGYEVAASADGRRDAEAVAANLSPAPGADRSGPLAAINSSLAMCPCDLAAGAPLDLRHSKSSLIGEAGTQRLAAMIQTFINQGGNMMTMTITDVEELKRAMVEPEKYRQLRVRMGGWSAYFCMLGEDQQLLQIKRGEQG